MQHVLPLDRDWEILLFMDACRYDYFEKCNTFDGNLEPYDIGCNGTLKYFDFLFRDQDCSDVIFINHLFWFHKWYDKSKFFKVHDACNTHWNQDFGTVLPEDMSKLALEYALKYPNKRVIAHYAQPHIPYLDRPKNLVKKKTEQQCVYSTPMKGSIAKLLNKCKNIFPAMPFWMIERIFGGNAGVGEIYFSEGFAGLKKSYEYNIRRVLKSIEEIIDKTDRLTVITSDHGKLIGEYFMFSHGWWKPKAVTTVPWFEVKRGE